MEDILEVTCDDTGMKLLIPVSKINAIVDDINGVFLETHYDNNGESSGIYIEETYEEVRKMLELSICGFDKILNKK